MQCVLKRLLLLMSVLGLLLSPGWHPWPDAPTGLAFADDNDDDDDDDDSDDAGGGGTGSTGDSRSPSNGTPSRSSSGSTGLLDFFTPLFQPPAPRRAAPQPAAPVASLPDNAPDEIVALGLSAEDLEILLAENFELISEQALPGLALSTQRLRVPPELSLIEARTRVRALPSGENADFNHYYRTNETTDSSACSGQHCPSWQLVAWTPSNTCGTGIRLGMVDTDLNEGHLTFANAALTVERTSDADLDRSRAVHGTAVAALLVGDHDSRSPGLLPQAELIAVDVFNRDGSDERADVISLIGGLASLAERNVDAINLSLAGPPNVLLEAVIDQLVAGGTILVAAAGNAGPRSEPLYPAAYDAVIAVTAVTLGSRVYRRAVQGPHIDLAAPGVDVWSAASVSGARWHTGTSFAAPFVTAAAAVLRQGEPDMTPDQIRTALAADARDLGTEGRDDVYGYGLVAGVPACGAVSLASEP